MIIIFIALLGYLIGSISFARIVVRLFSPDQAIQKIQVNVPGTETAYQSSSVSATAVNTQLGPRYGCLTSLLDMAKVGLPTLFLKLYFPDTAYFLIFAASATLGHIWPVYYNFRGGRGMSAILISFVILDWLGVLVSLSISLIVGLVRKEFYIGNKLSILLMIPWIWFRTQSWTLLLFVVALNLMNIVAVIPEIKQVNRLRKEGNLSEFLRAETLQVSQKQGTEFISRDTFYGAYRKMVRYIQNWFGKRFSNPDK